MRILAPIASIPCLRYTAFRFFLPLSCFYPLPYLFLYFANLLNFIVRIICSLSGWILCSLSINTRILLLDILVFVTFYCCFSPPLSRPLSSQSRLKFSIPQILVPVDICYNFIFSLHFEKSVSDLFRTPLPK